MNKTRAGSVWSVEDDLNAPPLIDLDLFPGSPYRLLIPEPVVVGMGAGTS